VGNVFGWLGTNGGPPRTCGFQVGGRCVVDFRQPRTGKFARLALATGLWIHRRGAVLVSSHALWGSGPVQRCQGVTNR
jgi:hypothetical protein